MGQTELLKSSKNLLLKIKKKKKKSSKNLIRLKGGHFRANWKLSNSGIKGTFGTLNEDYDRNCNLYY